MRENLIELVHNARMNALWHNAKNPSEYIADMLIDSGVKIPVPCKDCKHCYKSSGSSTGYRCKVWGVYDTDCEVTPDDFCSYGERKSDG